ncbi:hypothetical protein FDUTEX481_02129 [Tolypothrix sp. PCC 7601]|nr:hypothetical protein FDUTEX481_02129 [Tolypothrix sp. PCC 7601]
MRPSPTGRRAGGEGETLHKSGFHVKFTPMSPALPLTICRIFFQIGIKL